MANAYEFYQPYNWGDRWGSTEGRPSPHKGLDIPMPAGTPIPVHRSGVVVTVARSNSVGGYVVIRAQNGEYDTYCHIIPQVVNGQGISKDQVVGLIAGWDDDHGSAWNGPHLHLCRGTTIDAWASWGGGNLNPELIVLTGGLVGSSTPGSVPIIEQEEIDMTVVLINPGESAPRGGGLLISFAPGQAGHLTSYGPATANKTITGNAADGSGYWKLNFDADPRGSFSDLCQLFLGNAITPTALVAWFRANPGATYRVP